MPSIASPIRHRRLAAVVATLAVVTAFVTPSASAADQPYAATTADAQSAIEQAVATTGATSVVAGLTDAEALIWQGSAGVRDASGARPTAETRYGIGSTSKMLATAALMQLVDQGKVGLDQPVVRYLPEFTMRSPQYRQITVRMLLNHASGMPGSTYGNAFTTAPWRGYAEAVLDNLASSELKTTPGAMSVYCNDCFTVAGDVVAAVSGMPFTDYVQRFLLAPLSMDRSTYVTRSMPAAGTVARVVAEGRNLPLEVTNVYASGGLMSTPADMASFARMLLNAGKADGTRLLTPQSVAEMGRLQIRTTLDPIDDAAWAYGLGWDTVTDVSLAAVGQRAWVKGGDTADYHSSLIVLPDAGLAAFVAGAGTFSSSTAQTLAERMLLQALAERGDIPAVPAVIGTEQPAAVTPTVDDINAIVGTYLGVPGLSHRITRGPGDTLTLERLVDGAWTASPAALTFRADGAWWPTAPTAQSMRAVTGWGRAYLVVTRPLGYGNAMGSDVIGQRVESTGPTAAAWRARQGEWLYVGEHADSTAWLGRPATTLRAIPGLDGYLEVAGLSPVDARAPRVGSMFLQVPLMFGRDLDDLVPAADGMLRMGSAVMRSRATVPTLDEGANQVRIGSTGYAEWRQVPAAGRLTIRGAQAWYLYDAGLSLIGQGTAGKASVRAPKGALLVVFDAPGRAVTVIR